MSNILNASLCFSMLALLGGCSVLFPFTPAETHDFSALGKDVFSNLIREIYSYDQHGRSIDIKFHRDTGPASSKGIAGIDKAHFTHFQNVTKRSREFWLRKSQTQVEEIFTAAGGRCLPPKTGPTGPTEKYFYCEVIRQWTRAGLAVPESWSRVEMNMAHTFALSEADQVIGLHLKFILLTKYPPLNIK